MKTQIIQSEPHPRRPRCGVAEWIRNHRLISFALAYLLGSRRRR
jgi:hypothetical protein